ncbi:mechanosensitive ion channel family protein [Dysgonomonas sp. 216]|uniref:mechanosensitive ion channel family protein n=1 Tax=Dysgonomonas sp. 216 TaxID=2302934 RepID=UPI0021025A06|nr:mechanosensitive ion channel domain-containing protein [Dysgonomonas sp. 216]
METTELGIINKWLYKVLTQIGISEDWVVYVKLSILIILTIVIVLLLQYVVKKLLTYVFNKITKVTTFEFFGYAVKNKAPYYLALVVPYSFVRGAIPVIFEDLDGFTEPFLKITDIYLVFMVIWTVMSFVRAGASVIQSKSAFKNRPFQSYLQVIQIIFVIIGLIIVYSILTGKSATGFFTAMGAASAILMLMFKDTIMGFVASIQLSTNDMLHIGDWITMNKYGADGTVEEINLTTVKVVNFDKTITTIPTYALISDSFQNWRGMSESGGRRFTRSLYIKQSDIRFMKDEELEQMKKIEGLSEFITRKQTEFKDINEKLNIDQSLALNGHRLTNNDLFMEYANWYLRTHPRINQQMTLLVRQLAPTTQGLPVQLYTFTNTVVWDEYEGILSEILNHLISAVRFFDLRVFEETSGSDILDIEILKPQQNGK